MRWSGSAVRRQLSGFQQQQLKTFTKKTFIQNKSVQSLNLYTLDLYSKVKILHNLNTNFTKITILKQVTKL